MSTTSYDTVDEHESSNILLYYFYIKFVISAIQWHANPGEAFSLNLREEIK